MRATVFVGWVSMITALSWCVSACGSSDASTLGGDGVQPSSGGSTSSSGGSTTGGSSGGSTSSSGGSSGGSTSSSGGSSGGGTSSGGSSGGSTSSSGGSNDGGAVACPMGNAFPDDGCALDQSKGAPNYPSLLAGYPVRPPWNVAGVDYHVGVSSDVTLQDPTTAQLPAGCSYANYVVTCAGSGITVSGYDFSLHGGVQLFFSDGTATNVTISNNKFGVTQARCQSPILFESVSGNVAIRYNTLDGGASKSSACPMEFNGLVVATLNAGASYTVEYNVLSNVSEDGVDLGGPTSGAASVTIRYNLWYVQGFTGHPDGIQTCGGHLGPIVANYNTMFTPASSGAFVQPLHVEAQCSGTISDTTVASNTVLTPGSCQGSAWPAGCAANSDIACKQDSPTETNTNYRAYGNYVDATGSLGALDNGYNCPSTTWGSPKPNYDITSGQTLTTTPN